MTFPVAIVGVPIIKEQKDLLLDLVEASKATDPDGREPFTAAAVATSDNLLLSHAAAYAKTIPACF